MSRAANTAFYLDYFNEIVEDQEPDIACDCRWHEERGHTGAVEWVVVMKPWCHSPSGVRLWCDQCLQAVLANATGVWCRTCFDWYTKPLRTLVASYEPLRKAP